MTLNDKRISSVTELPKADELKKQKPIVHTIPPKKTFPKEVDTEPSEQRGEMASLQRRHTEPDSGESKQNKTVTYRAREKRSDIVSHLG